MNDQKPAALLNTLAKNRTILANERTLLAYLRTAIMLFVSGVTLIKFFGSDIYLSSFGFLLLPIALALILFGYLRYRRMCGSIEQLETRELNETSNPEDPSSR